ncbi:hypothetical protein Chor_011995 [Crotalus horridus]
MYGNTLSREADLPCKVWRSLPPEPAEQSGLSNEGPSICSPAQWKKYWKRNQIGVLLILTGICFLLIVLFLLLSYNSILLELRSLNLNSTKEDCDASPAPFNFTELETNFITKLKSLEQRFDEKRNISLQKMEEQLLRIEIKLNILQNCRDISWQRFETNAYYFSDTEQNWEMAKEKCAEHDSHLVIINTKKEQTKVVCHSVCVCTIHQNIKLMLQGANIKEHYKLLMGKAVCDLNTKDCMLQRCQNCPGEEALIAHFDELFEHWDLEESIEFTQWVHTDREMLETNVLIVDGFIEKLAIKMWKLTGHHFVSKHQANI